ncbi:MAG: hypothetical protein LBH25_02170 [Fibromonadaceae bacterium]|nr:hypothetical protein [Fibromonadaceae bacterium]
MECSNREKNKERCSCASKDCCRNGFCCECVAFHKQKGNLPVCLRNIEVGN